MQLREVLRRIRANWILIVVTLVVCVLAGLAAAVLTPVKYSTETKVLIKPEVNSANATVVNDASSFVSAQIPTYTALVSTPAVLDPAVQSLGLKTPTTELQKDVSASTTSNTAIITITALAETPKAAADLANGVATSLLHQVQTEGTASAAVGVTGSVVEAPALPTAPAQPNYLIDLLVGLVVGLALAFIFVAIREALRAPAPVAAR